MRSSKALTQAYVHDIEREREKNFLCVKEHISKSEAKPENVLAMAYAQQPQPPIARPSNLLLPEPMDASSPPPTPQPHLSEQRFGSWITHAEEGMFIFTIGKKNNNYCLHISSPFYNTVTIQEPELRELAHGLAFRVDKKIWSDFGTTHQLGKFSGAFVYFIRPSNITDYQKVCCRISFYDPHTMDVTIVGFDSLELFSRKLRAAAFIIATNIEKNCTTV